MRNEGVDMRTEPERFVESELADGTFDARAPRPSAQFRHRAWREFQRAIDPLAPPRPLRRQRHH
jgi:hypothetical protein